MDHGHDFPGLSFLLHQQKKGTAKMIEDYFLKISLRIFGQLL
jgi:hypothetical protein